MISYGLAPNCVTRGGFRHGILWAKVFSGHHRKAKTLFIVSDALLTAAAFEAAYQTRVALPLENVFFLVPPVKALLLAATVMLWPLIGAWLKVYDRLEAAHPQVVLRDTFRQSAFGAIGIVLIEFTLRLDLSRPFLGLFVVYSWILLCLFRLNAVWVVGWFRREFTAPYYILVAGVGERAQRLGEALEQSAPYGIRLIGFLAADGNPPEEQIRLSAAYPVYPLKDLSRLLEKHVVDEVIFAVDSKRLSELEDVLLLCDEDGVRTRVAVDFFPHVNSEVYLDRLHHTPLLTFSAAPHDELQLLVKRVIDVGLAAAGLVLLAPFMLVVSLLVRLTSPGPVIFRQTRCGLNGRRFTFYKFRSMCQNAEELKLSLQHLNRKRTAFKIPNDPRLTRVGRFLRKFSIDEWPQLWNVLRGDMSLVGPRPAVPEEVEQYRRWQRRRLRMRPGLTCLWALEGRDTLDFDTWMKKDMEYIDNWSLSLDWKILVRTIPRVLTGKGAL
jgi:exopolysaccharide biosynthesis polyprenyl glycosylphosphotransferase